MTTIGGGAATISLGWLKTAQVAFARGVVRRLSGLCNILFMLCGVIGQQSRAQPWPNALFKPVGQAETRRDD
jgi:hypothetical protein